MSRARFVYTAAALMLVGACDSGLGVGETESGQSDQDVGEQTGEGSAGLVKTTEQASATVAPPGGIDPNCTEASCCPAGYSILEGSPARDVLFPGAASTCVLAKGGRDLIVPGSGAADLLVYGGPGGDVVFAPPNGAALFGGGGRDTLYGSNGEDYIDAGPAADVVYAKSGSDTVVGSEGRDYLVGGSGDDQIEGGLGNDVVVGDGVFASTPGLDRLNGNGGNDVLWGGDLGDFLAGGRGDDVLYGGRGDDELRAGPGVDVVFAGEGNDTIVISDACELSDGDTIVGGPGFDTLFVPFEPADIGAFNISVVGVEEIERYEGPTVSECSGCHCLANSSGEVKCCSGNGSCTNDAVCECDPGFVGAACSGPPEYTSTVGGTQLLASCPSDEPGCSTIRTDMVTSYVEVDYTQLCGDLNLVPHDPEPENPLNPVETVLRFRSYFPADSMGNKVSGTFPVLVFSHGNGQFASAYTELHAYLALNDLPVYSIEQPDATLPSERADRFACMLRWLDQNEASRLDGRVFLAGHSRGGEAAQIYGERLKVTTDVGQSWADLSGVGMLAPGYVRLLPGYPVPASAPLYVWAGGLPDNDVGLRQFEHLSVLDVDLVDSSAGASPTTLVATNWRGFVHNRPGGRCPTNGQACLVDADCTSPNGDTCNTVGLCVSSDDCLSTEQGTAFGRTYFGLPFLNAISGDDDAREILLGDRYTSEIENLFGVSGGGALGHEYRDGPAYGGDRVQLNSFESTTSAGFTASGADLTALVRQSDLSAPTGPPGLGSTYGGKLDLIWTQEGQVVIPVDPNASQPLGGWTDVDYLSFGLSRPPEGDGQQPSFVNGCSETVPPEPDLPIFVELVDNNDDSFEVDVSDYLVVDAPPSYDNPNISSVCFGASFFRSVRVPLSAFCAGGVDVSAGIKEVRFRLADTGIEHRAYLDDVEFTNNDADDGASCGSTTTPTCTVGDPGDPGCACLDVKTSPTGSPLTCTSFAQDGCFPDGPGSYGNASISDPLSGDGQYCVGDAICGLVKQGTQAVAECVACPSSPSASNPAPYGCPCFADTDCAPKGVTGNTTGDFDGGIEVDLRCVAGPNDGWNNGPGTCLPALDPLTLVGIPGASPDPLREEFYRTRWLCKNNCETLEAFSRPLTCVFKPGGGITFQTATCLETTCDSLPGEVCAEDGNRCGAGNVCAEECSSNADCAALGYPSGWGCATWSSERRCAPPACLNQPTVGGTLQTPSLAECEAYMYGGTL